jgi:hypothetical protein
MQVDEGVLQSGVTEQELEGAQIGPGFQQMGGTAVSTMYPKT